MDKEIKRQLLPFLTVVAVCITLIFAIYILPNKITILVDGHSMGLNVSIPTIAVCLVFLSLEQLPTLLAWLRRILPADAITTALRVEDNRDAIESNTERIEAVETQVKINTGNINKNSAIINIDDHQGNQRK